MNNNIDNVIGFDALLNSMYNCKRNVSWKNSVMHYVLNGLEQTIKLEEKLHNGKYKPKPPCKFSIGYPKPREIMSIYFIDRVYQRSLNDNALYPTMTKSFIRDNCACQKNKGTDYTRNRLKAFLQKFYRKYGNNGYVLQCDIHGYYPNMRHDVAKNTFKRKLNPEIYDKVATILDEQYEGEIGFNAGSQMIQIAGISVLDFLDHFIKEVLHIKYYIRYMDDFILIHNDKNYLEYCKTEIKKKLINIGFEFNPKKTVVYPMSKGILFLGFIFKLTNTGKVLMLINKDNVKHARKKLRKLVSLCKKGKISKAKVDFCYQCWINHISKGNSYLLIQRMNIYYKKLWE